ncbi:hypothetical protein CDV36_012528 [Fusarium kuroshium]|uniref:F-box domain-containing protein n=2 Tax=Fusarium solani species complex TaxID=232080 RepID=A0A3M2RRA8_9HYPO|nr:hypothetical protein CDV36_012528 [Fusarium kuroshium]RSL89924.1 hypothetical protein CEP51_001014 [Fusarium floridanum]
MGSGVQLTPEIISKLTLDEEDDPDEFRMLVIRNLQISTVKPIPSKSPTQSLGMLDTVPSEILLSILEYLDFQSLCRLTLVCLRGKLAVESMRAYREMRLYAGNVLAALGKTRLIKYHSAALLRQTLHSSRCVSCFDFGGFLFLPTCERVCFECLYHNQGLHMMTPNTAKKCFDLTDRQLKSIPTLFSIPGTYNVRNLISRKRVFRLVCVKQAKQLALQVHGSPESVAKIIPKAPPRGIETNEAETKEYWMLRGFHEAPLEPPGCDLSLLPPKEEAPDDEFGGMAAIRMPYLSNKSLDHGRLCRGCQLLLHLHDNGKLPLRVLRSLVPEGLDVHAPLFAQMTRLRSGDVFAKHLTKCYGARDLLKQWGYFEKNRRLKKVEE